MVPLLSAIWSAGLGEVEFEEGEVVFVGEVVFEEGEEDEDTSEGEVLFVEVVFKGRDWAIEEGKRDVMVKRRDRTVRRVDGIRRAIVRVRVSVDKVGDSPLLGCGRQLSLSGVVGFDQKVLRE